MNAPVFMILKSHLHVGLRWPPLRHKASSKAPQPPSYKTFEPQRGAKSCPLRARQVTHGVSRSLTGHTQAHVSWAVARPVGADPATAARCGSRAPHAARPYGRSTRTRLR